jgi:tetratricopeptide (TPR) repeat protein
MISRFHLGFNCHGPMVIVFLVALLSTTSHALYQSEQDEIFNRAVEAYKNNRLSDARTLFERIKGPHADEAGQYIAKIKTYIDAMQVADSIMRRSPDELDSKNLDFAITQYQAALSVKNDGPWNPKEKLDRAVALKSKLGQKNGERVRGLCQKAVDAAKGRDYKLAERLSCMLANDNPSFSCNGNEAVLMCEQMGDLAKIKPDRDVGEEEKDSGPVTQSAVATPHDCGSLDEAIAAYNNNDLANAQALFQRADDAHKAAATEYLKKIERYQTAMQNAESAARDNEYEKARAAYEDALAIKQDGPGNPAAQAFLMDLLRGVDEFYSGDYAQADQQLNAYLKESSAQAGLAHFYIGACKMARFFIGGAQEAVLRDDATNEFRMAKKAGFQPKAQEVSPKILKAFEQAVF